LYPDLLLPTYETTLEEAREIWPERAPALARNSPLEDLRLALQSIDSWCKVAEGALRTLEEEAK
jgi:hypothetical protein